MQQASRQRIDRLVRTLAEGPPGPVHALGAGGVGLAGVAYLLHRAGCSVSGCDLQRSSRTDWLEARGIAVTFPHDPAHLDGGPAFCVRSAAVPADHPECLRAVERGVPVYHRAEALAALSEQGAPSIAVAGTHGKTTTAAMLATLLAAAGPGPPAFCIGGEVDALGGVAGSGGPGFVLEADESDGTLVLYRPDVGVVTNIEFDHMEHFESPEAFVGCFRRFVGNARRAVVLNQDDPCCRELAELAEQPVRFGFGSDADLRATGLEPGPDASSFRLHWRGRDLGPCRLNVGGRHHAANALAAAAAALSTGTDPDAVIGGLARFRHVRRRFERIGEGRGVLVVSDYAHHPTEVRAVLETAAGLGRGRIVAVFQPHRYTRTLALGHAFPPSFAGADRVILTPVYPASERPLEGGRGEDLFRRFQACGTVPVRYASDLREAWSMVLEDLRAGDLLLLLGAGDVETLVQDARRDLLGEEEKA